MTRVYSHVERLVAVDYLTYNFQIIAELAKMDLVETWWMGNLHHLSASDIRWEHSRVDLTLVIPGQSMIVR